MKKRLAAGAVCLAVLAMPFQAMAAPQTCSVSGCAMGSCFMAADEDGMCGNHCFTDENGDGICDYHCYTDGNSDGVCDYFVDDDSDGICDHCHDHGRTAAASSTGTVAARSSRRSSGHHGSSHHGSGHHGHH